MAHDDSRGVPCQAPEIALALAERARTRDPRRHHPRHPPPGPVPRLRRARERHAASGTWTATSTSTTGWVTARSSWATAIRRSCRRCRRRWRAALTWAPATSSRCAGRSWSTSWCPCAELTRFTMSGTEATHLAMRVARAFTGRPQDREARRPLPWLARRRGGRREPAVRGADVGGRARRHDRAGARSARPTTSRRWRWPSSAATWRRSSWSPPAAARAPRRPSPAISQELRALTTRHGVVLIFDEVITGFRYSPGGAQAVLRRHARSHHAGQDRGRRPAGRRAVRPARHHVDARLPRRCRLGPQPARGPRRDLQRQSAVGRGRPSPRWSCAPTPRCRRAPTRRARSCGARSPRPCKTRGRAGHVLRRGVDLSRVVRGQARAGRLRPPAQGRALPAAALRAAQQRRGLLAATTAGSRAAHRGGHRADGARLRGAFRAMAAEGAFTL